MTNDRMGNNECIMIVIGMVTVGLVISSVAWMDHIEDMAKIAAGQSQIELKEP